MLIDGSPQQIRLAAQRHEHLVEVPRTARLASRRFGALGESGAELLAPATDRFIRDYNATLEQQLLDVAQAQAESEIPANRAADDDGGEAMAMIKRLCLLHSVILPPPLHQPDRASGSAAQARHRARSIPCIRTKWSRQSCAARHARARASAGSPRRRHLTVRIRHRLALTPPAASRSFP